MNSAASISQGSEYLIDWARVKEYGENSYSITLLRCYKPPGYEPATQKAKKSVGKGKKNKGKRKKKGKGGSNSATGSVKRFASSINRAKAIIRELAKCNKWDYYVTFTFDGQKYNRSDLVSLLKKLLTWIRNFNRLNKTKIKYLLVPEQDKDGNWHMHGLLMGLPVDHLREVDYFRHRIIYDWDKYASKFGHVRVEEINDINHVVEYLVKQLTIENTSAVRNMGSKLYYSSKGLKRAEVIHQGHLTKDLENPDFENQYVKRKHFTDFDEVMDHFN